VLFLKGIENMLMSLVKHVEYALHKTFLESSKCTKEILEMSGMTGRLSRHFYNNLCSLANIRYLEIGTWKGSITCSSMCGNSIQGLCIDNWSEFIGEDVRMTFMAMFNKYLDTTNNVDFKSVDCWSLDPDELARTYGKFNIYVYDGNHSPDSHRKALSHFMPCLDTEFVYIVENWNNLDIRNATYQAIRDNKLSIVYMFDIFTTGDNSHPPAHNCGSNSQWHNGLGIYLLHKS
jgi:hypothetical protein